MPGGRTHNIINIIVLTTIVAGLYLLKNRYDITLLEEHLNIKVILVFSLSYLFGTFFLSPDLDIDSSAYDRWGIFKFLWWPYKELFKHRGMSHHPVFGPLTILIYFALIVILVLVIVGFDASGFPVDAIAALLLGIVMSIEIHILADMVVSELN